MKKIISKIINAYNRYFLTKFKKIIFFLIHLSFMKNNKINISVFNRYLILLIVLLFSYLFYLSIPALYNYGELQNYLTNKLKKEFNLETALSANITYNILPSPNFEIRNVLLNTNMKNELDAYAQVKKMRIYVSSKNLHNQKKIKIKKILISEANFDINKNSFKYINHYLKQKIINKKINIKKSKIFFKEDNTEKDVVALSTIIKSDLFYNEKKNSMQLNMNGSIFNTNYNLELLKNTYLKDTTEVKIKFNKLNTLVKNKLYKKNDNYEGKTYINFSGSEINVDYDINKNLIKLISTKSKLNNKNIEFSGDVNISPFYFNLEVNLEDVNVKKLFENLPKINNFLDEKILLNKKINGKIVFNINSLKKFKFFDKAKLVLVIRNGRLLLNGSELISNKIGKVFFKESILESIEDKKTFKSKILFEILNQKKFYQKFQVPKANRIELKNIFVEFEKDFNFGDYNVKKLIINKKESKNSSGNINDLSELIDANEIKKIENWIELKNFSNQIFADIVKIN